VEVANPVAPEKTEHDILLQQQIILDSYENQEATHPKKAVDDIYSQYQQTGVSATFPGNKYSTNGEGIENIQFENELDKFRYAISLNQDLETRLEWIKRLSLNPVFQKKLQRECMNCARIAPYSVMKR
jgi:hypothetical protein